jgi:glutathione S-transferase
MKLLGSTTSPFVRKVRVVLAEKRLDYRFELENVMSPDSRIKESNPLGKVPCLIMEDGGAVFDSRVIVEYLDGLAPNAKLIPPNGRTRIEVKTWEALADGVSDAAVAVRMESLRPENLRSADFVARQMGKVDTALEAMANGLADKPWCAGAAFSLADIASGVALGYLDFRFPQLDWRARHANLARLHERLLQRPPFAETLPTD